jgi:hypothetical protein
VRSSTSAGLRRRDTGEAVAGSDGLHVYIEIRDVADSARFLKALHQRCWLKGFGWFVVGRGGQLLERSLIDRMVGSPERLVFERPPVLDPRLEQDAEARRPRAIAGAVLDTLAACPPLTPMEDTRLGTLQARARVSLAGESAKVREKFIDDQADSIATRAGISRLAARHIVSKLCNGILLPAIVLPFDDEELAGKTVADVLTDPAQFEGETLSDPLEGPEYGRCKAMVMRRSDGTVCIHSFAHGRTMYEMRLDAAAVRLKVEAADKDEVLRFLIDLLLRADVDLVEEEALVRLAGKRSGSGMRTVKSELKAAREGKAKAEHLAARERKRAARNDTRPQVPRPGDAAEWLPQMHVLNNVIGKSTAPHPPARDIDGAEAKGRQVALPKMHAFITSNEKEGDLDQPASSRAMGDGTSDRGRNRGDDRAAH